MADVCESCAVDSDQAFPRLQRVAKRYGLLHRCFQLGFIDKEQLRDVCAEENIARGASGHGGSVLTSLIPSFHLVLKLYRFQINFFVD